MFQNPEIPVNTLSLKINNHVLITNKDGIRAELP